MTENILLYPLGTVVVVNDIESPVMISGYMPEATAVPGHIWDYVGVSYPSGIEGVNKLCAFDHASIHEVLFIGYQESESFIYMQKVQDAADEVIRAFKAASASQVTEIEKE